MAYVGRLRDEFGLWKKGERGGLIHAFNKLVEAYIEPGSPRMRGNGHSLQHGKVKTDTRKSIFIIKVVKLAAQKDCSMSICEYIQNLTE